MLILTDSLIRALPRICFRAPIVQVFDIKGLVELYFGSELPDFTDADFLRQQLRVG